MQPTLPKQSNTALDDITGLSEYDGHEFLMSLHDEASGLKAYVAVHNTNRGPALGGTRMLAYGNDQEAIRDVLNLSRAMSYKCALANLPYGGGKAVIIGSDVKDRDAVLFAYARLVDKLGGLFRTGTDVGISDADVVKMSTQTTRMLGTTEADRGTLTTAGVAALGVFHAMRATLRHLNGTDDFTGIKVAVKGVGKLGGDLVRHIMEAGGEVYIADIDEERCKELKAKWPTITIVSIEEIHTQAVDIYAPCALGNEFNPDNISELRCKAVVGGANNQLSEPHVGGLFAERGILYAPDYIANAGGLIYVADELEPGGFNQARVISRTKEIEQTMEMVFQQAAQQQLPTSLVADQLALKRIQGAHNE